MRKRVVTNVLRGLTIALLVPILSTNFIIVGYGLTVDDFKAYVGEAVNQADRTIVVEGQVGDETILNYDDTDEGTSQLDRLKKSFSEYEKQLEQRMNGSDDTLTIAALVSSMNTLRKDIANKEKEEQILATQSIGKGYNQDEMLDYIISSANVEIDELDFDTNSISSKFFDIGYFGDYYFKPVDNALKIVTPYGYKQNQDGTYDNKHLGMDIAAYRGSDVKSMFNGIISNVEKDVYGENDVVTMYHGNGLYTVYHHLEVNEEMTKGKRISYNDTVGTTVDTTKHEPNKENHMFIQVILDEKYINPIYVFGNTGKAMYEEWAGKTVDRYAVDSGEYFYYTDNMSVENVNKDIKPNIIYEDQATVVDEDYTVPNPGILDNVQEQLGAGEN